jgi:glycosyltransferase involved in cell wall biosynthesis
MRPFKICYLLESSDLSGGVRVVLDQARAISSFGHEVTVRARFGDHTWYPYPVNIDYVTDLAEPSNEVELDVAIATFWTTVEAAMRLPARLAVHFCQGCEFDCAEYSLLTEEIEAAYRNPLPKLTVGEWISDRLRLRFGPDRFPVACIGEIVDTDMYGADGREQTGRPLWCDSIPHILIVGIYECSLKGVSTALDAVEQVRRQGFRLHLTRVSPLPLSSEERSHTVIDTHHQCISPLKMADVYRSADIFLAPSTEAEGFGLPFAEALASGLPTVASRISSFLSLGPPHDYAYFVPVGDAEAMAEGLRRLLVDTDLREELGRRGAQVVKGRFSAGAVAKKLETYLQEMLA